MNLSTKQLDNSDFKLVSVISSIVNVHKKDLNNDTSQFLIMVMTHFFRFYFAQRPAD